MKVMWRIGAVVLIAIAMAATSAQAQPRGGMRGDAPRYDPATEETVRGTVKQVKQIENWMGRQGTGVHLVVETEQAPVEVHLGPSAYLTQQKAEFKEGDQVEVVGSRVKYENADAIIAREVRKGETTVTLRDERGFPRWSRGPR